MKRRPIYLIYTDKLPNEFEIDQTATQTQLNSIYDLKTDGQMVTVSLNTAGIQVINQDKTKGYQLPPINLIGNVTKPDINLTNDFNLTYNEDSYTSNTVTNDTKLQALYLPNTGSHDQLTDIMVVSGWLILISLVVYVRRCDQN